MIIITILYDNSFHSLFRVHRFNFFLKISMIPLASLPYNFVYN